MNRYLCIVKDNTLYVENVLMSKYIEITKTQFIEFATSVEDAAIRVKREFPNITEVIPVDERVRT